MSSKNKETENCPHVQVKFFTKQEQYSIADDPYSLSSNVGAEELSGLINGILDNTGTGDHKKIEFDFLINGEFLRTNLQDYIEHKELSTEAVIELEYIERECAPTPEDSLLHDDWVSCIHSAESYILSGCYDYTVKIWNNEGTNLVTIPGHTAAVKCLSWIKPDDKTSTFVTGSHDQVLLTWQWNRDTNAVKCLHQCKGHAGSVDCVAVNRDKTKFCSGSWDTMLKIWSTEGEDCIDDNSEDSHTDKKRKTENKVPTQVPLVTLSGHREAVSSVRWMGDCEIITASWDHTMKIWDVETATEKSSLNGTKVFLDVAFSTLNRMVVTASSDRHVRLWDPRNSDGSMVVKTFTSHAGWVTTVSWSPSDENMFISGSYDSVLKLWDVRSPTAPLYNMSGHHDRILCSDWSIPELMLSGGADNHLKIFKYSKNLKNK